MTPVRTCVCILASCILAFLLGGCGGSEPSPHFGDWTLQKGGLTLTEDLRVSETENYFFGSIADLDVGNEGRIVVADQEAYEIKILRPDGTLLDTLGRQGEAPGEFQYLWGVQVDPTGSIYAHDFETARITVFDPSSPSPVTRTISLPRSPRPSGGSLQGVFPSDFWVAGSNLLVEYFDRAPPADGGPAYRTVGFMGESGILQDTLLRGPYPPRERISVDGVVQFKYIPYGRDTEVTLGPGNRLYSGYEDSLRIVAHAMDGTSETVANVSTPPVPIHHRERDSVLKEMEREVRRVMASIMPETKPAFTELVVADDGRLWMRRAAEGPNPERVPWWVLDPEAKTIREVHLPPEVNIEVVQGGKAYGTTTTEAGAPAVIRYEIRTES